MYSIFFFKSTLFWMDICKPSRTCLHCVYEYYLSLLKVYCHQAYLGHNFFKVICISGVTSVQGWYTPVNYTIKNMSLTWDTSYHIMHLWHDINVLQFTSEAVAMLELDWLVLGKRVGFNLILNRSILQGILWRSTPGKWLKNNLQKTVLFTCSNL